MSTSAFVGREYETERLRRIIAEREASVATVYGRRRVGKTTLIEHVFTSPFVIKCEGIEGRDQRHQRESMLEQFAEQVGIPALKHANPDSWRSLLRLMTEFLVEGRKTLYLEEFQWLSGYQGELIAEIKYFWDNYWRKNETFILILCGSSPSFMVSKVIRSKAMHNRALHEFHLLPFSMREIHQFLGQERSREEALDALLLVGGIPEYLKYLRQESSLYLSLARNAFTPNAFFAGEYDRVFISSLEHNPHYKKVVAFLGAKRNATRNEIAKHLGIASGGNLTDVLADLELCGFIRRYTPFDKSPTSLLARYEIADPYLQLYHRVIEPRLSDIREGRYRENPLGAFNIQQMEQWLGYSLERHCRSHAHRVAEHLGFSDVDYRAGAFFNRGTDRGNRGFQIDLVYQRADRVVTLCEIKNNSAPISVSDARKIVDSFACYSPPPGYRVQKVLLAKGGVQPNVSAGLFFDKIVDPLDIFF